MYVLVTYVYTYNIRTYCIRIYVYVPIFVYGRTHVNVRTSRRILLYEKSTLTRVNSRVNEATRVDYQVQRRIRTYIIRIYVYYTYIYT